MGDGSLSSRDGPDQLHNCGANHHDEQRRENEQDHWKQHLHGHLLGCLLGARGQGLAAIGAAFLAGACVLALAQRRIGGFTGDVLGAAGVVGETAALLVLAASW